MTTKVSPKAYTAEQQERFASTVAKYPHKKAALLTCLWIAQEIDSYISLEAMKYIALLLEIPTSHVYTVVGFYSMYLTQPKGKFHIQVCHTLSCELAGSEAVIETIQSTLGIKPGETTEDGQFSLTRVECLAACGEAPMCQINRSYFVNLNADKTAQLLADLQSGAQEVANA